jgi:hypothetical protein
MGTRLKQKRVRRYHQVRPAESVPTSISTYIKGRELQLLLLLILAILAFVFRDYLLLNKVYLFKDIGSDSLNIFYPTYVNTAEYIRNEGIPGWSSSVGMGQSIFPAGITDPFTLTLLLMGRNLIPYAIIFNEALKIILGGLFFLLYLRTLRLSTYSSIVGGVLFSFCGYMVVGGSGWYGHSTEAVWAALLLYSFEKFFTEGKWYLLPIPIALIGASQPFYLYVYGLFLVMYATVRFLDEKGWNPRVFAVFLLQLGSLCLLGAAISTVSSAGVLVQILNSPRGSGNTSYTSVLSSRSVFDWAPPLQYISLLRGFSNDVLGTGNSFKGWQNYLEAPILYSGLACFLLAPQFFCSLQRRRQILFAAVVMLCSLPLIFPFFRYLFWLFTGDYFRAFSFFLSIVMLFFSLQALNHIDKSSSVSLKVLLSSLAVAFGALYLPYDQKNLIIDSGVRALVTLFLLMYGVLIYLMRSRYRVHAQVLLLAVICVEAAAFSNITVNNRESLSKLELEDRKGYNDYTNEAIAFLKKNDPTFFRVNKDYSSGPAMHASLNDAMVQQFYGTPSYSSFNQMYYVRFLQGMDIIREGDERATRWVLGLGDRQLLMSLASVKYNLTKDPRSPRLTQGYELTETFGDVSVLRNLYALPLGFTYDKYVPASKFSRVPPENKDRLLLKAFVVDDGDAESLTGLRAFNPEALTGDYTYNEYSQDVGFLKKESLSISKHTQNRIEGTITVQNPRLLFLSIPYDSGWSATVDGMAVDIRTINIGFMGIPLTTGTHTVVMTFETPYFVAGRLISGASLLLYGCLFVVLRRKNCRKAHDASMSPDGAV